MFFLFKVHQDHLLELEPPHHPTEVQCQQALQCIHLIFITHLLNTTWEWDTCTRLRRKCIKDHILLTNIILEPVEAPFRGNTVRTCKWAADAMVIIQWILLACHTITNSNNNILNSPHINNSNSTKMTR